MSATSPCVPCCSTPVSVNVPGIAGVDGSDGAAGVDGLNAFCFTTTDTTVPGLGADVTVDVTDNSWMVLGQIVAMGTGIAAVAHFQVKSKPAGTLTAVLTFLGYEPDVAPATVINSGAEVGPAGSQPDVSGFAASGANADITSLTALSTPLSIGQGGTGATTAAGARTALGVSRTPQDYIQIREWQANTTSAGTFTAGAARTRGLNDITFDTGSHAALLGGGQFTLAAGTYRCLIKAPAYKVGHHVAWLQNVTDAATLLMGSTETAAAADACQTSSIITGRFTLAGTKTLEVQHWCQTTEASDGFGIAASLGFIETYCVAVFEREA